MMSMPSFRLGSMRGSLAIGFALVGVLVLAAALSYIWTPWPPAAINVPHKLAEPSWQHWLGTDALGRDVLSGLIAGARVSLMVGVVAVGIGLLIGVALGLIAANFGGVIEDALMKLSDFAFAFPALLLAILLTATYGAGVFNAIIAIGVANAPIFAKLTRSAANGILAREFTLAARAAGRGPVAIAFDHVLPNIAPLLIVQATIQFAIAILAEAALSYLGLGAQPPVSSWGRMLADAQPWIYVAPRTRDLSGNGSRLVSARPQSVGRWPARCARSKTQGAHVTALLEVESLAVDLPTAAGMKRIVRDISFTVDAGESLGVVGESGSGKTITALAVMGLLPEGARIEGRLNFEGENLAGASETEMLKLRGNRAAMIFQEPMTALNPLHRVGAQVAEPLRLHRGLPAKEAMRKAIDLLARVRLRDPERLARAYPFQLSGGERQRVMIAMAISCEPRLLVADEPTTALDVTVQARILDLIAVLAEESRAAIMLISHDLAVVARHCKRVIVMYAGEMMEEGPAPAVLGDARHPYTQALLSARPRFGVRGQRLAAIPGAAPAAGEAIVGCRFASRCPRVAAVCTEKPPPVVKLDGRRSLRCARVDAEGRPI